MKRPHTRVGGCRRDQPHKHVQKCSRTLVGAAPKNPASADVSGFAAGVLDQGPTGACTGHGGAQGLVIAFAAAGRPLPFVPSPDGLYRDERCLERTKGPDGTFPPLTDEGAEPADLFRAGALCGVRAIQAPTADGRNSDVDPATVNDEPRLDQSATEALTIITGGYRIDETAADMAEQVCAALAAKMPVGLGFFCDSRFQAWTPAAGPLNSYNLQDQTGGGHFVVIVGYRTDASGARIFRILNSWSALWGDTGFIEVTTAWLRAVAWDLYIFNVSEPPTQVENKVAA